jgi:hypothetical protein
MVGQQM